jgi:hypothetical protein
MSQPPYSGPPYPGQPYSGQPNPDVPSSVPPQPGFPPPHQQPQYGAQPGYPTSAPPGYPTSGPPGYPPSGQPGYPPEPGYQPAPEYGTPAYATAGPPMPPPKKSKALPIILISLAVVLVLCVGGAAAVFIAARDTAGDIVEAAESAAATPPATSAPLDPADPTPTETAPAAKTITIVEPKTLGGRPKLTDPQFAGAAEQLQSGLDDVPGATNTVGALYGTPAKRDIVIIAGVEAPVDNPTQELNGTFLGAGVGGLKVTGITTVNPGPLGGVAKCGKTSTSGVDMVMCGWADDGSVGWIIWYFKSISKAKAEFPKLRAQIEKSS